MEIAAEFVLQLIKLSSKQYVFVLDGILTIPEQEKNPKKGIVVFAHGSGSGRHSPRNQYVASVLNDSGISTLLVDLLTEEEQKIDEKTREYRFNIKLLSNRLSAITDWLLVKNPETLNFTVGYFGASTGAAAALMTSAVVAAEDRPTLIKAIVSRAGRPDLAGSSSLKQVQAPTLLIVGSKDNAQIIGLNQKAMQQLKNVKKKRLVMVPEAGHLFEEPGTLEEAATHAASWFEQYL